MDQLKNENTIKIAISKHALAKMLDENNLHVTDIRCLDGESKKQVWELCLKSIHYR